MNLKMIIILSNIFSSSSSVASLLPARSFESTYLAKMKEKCVYWLNDAQYWLFQSFRVF